MSLAVVVLRERIQHCILKVQRWITYVDDIANLVEGLPCDDLLEVVEHGISSGGVGEGSDGSRAGPRDDRHEEDTDEDGTTDTVHHQQEGEDTGKTTLSICGPKT